MIITTQAKSSQDDDDPPVYLATLGWMSPLIGSGASRQDAIDQLATFYRALADAITCVTQDTDEERRVSNHTFFRAYDEGAHVVFEEAEFEEDYD